MGVLIEAVVVGIGVVVLGTVISFVYRMFSKHELPPVCNDWNKNFAMEICLFLTGFVFHILCEFAGVNKWYCTNGSACTN